MPMPDKWLAANKTWFDYQDALPKPWRELCQKYPCVDEIVSMYYNRVPLYHADKMCLLSVTEFVSTKWPRDYPLQPMYDPRIKEPYQ